jgi:inner membrane protein
MDTLSHSILAALTAKSCAKIDVKKSYVLATALAAAFPDIDYLLFWLNPYKFITEWHRGLTHSLVILPLWAAMISLILYWILQKRIAYRMLFACCCLGLLTHLAADLITLYGVQLLAPFSNRRYALFTLFDMDPWVGLLAASGLILAFYNRRFAKLALLAILAYLLLVFNWQQNAKTILANKIEKSSVFAANSYAVPQPFIPFHWKLVVDRGDYYEIAHLSLFVTASHYISQQLQSIQSYTVMPLSWLHRITKENLPAMADRTHYNLQIADMADYRAANNLHWKKISKFGNTHRVSQVWQHDAFAEFRHFAIMPVLYRIDQYPDSACIWFTDLRYVFPLMMPPFRYGMCKQYQSERWQLFRLRRHTENSRQLINVATP